MPPNNAVDDEDSLYISGTPLDRTMDKIGMGGYQYTLLALCGLGWAADNMWLQAVAIALPRVQFHYAVQSSSIGYLSASIFLGMMLGALLWGTLSDLFGRLAVFQLTLCFSALFGFFAFYVDTFPVLCFANFLLGTAVGGSMPTDGTFALETLPRNKRHLLTSLSIFFSFGSVLAALVALLVVPQNTCFPEEKLPNRPCDKQKDNNGWKYLFLVCTLITVVMFLARVLFFRSRESPRYLVHSGRKEEAAIALTHIAKFNGSPFPITVADVNDDNERSEGTDMSSTSRLRNGFESGNTEETERLLESSPSIRSTRPLIARGRNRSFLLTTKPSGVLGLIRRWITAPLFSWWNRITGLLSGEWKERTILIWGVWCTMALAFTMFNVFLPTLLEYRSNGDANYNDEREQQGGGVNRDPGLVGALSEIVVFTLAGCPGALLGAYLVDLGPRHQISKSLVLSIMTFITGLSCLAFVFADSHFWVAITTAAMSLTSTAMWSILYGMTPELFITEVRGTACGTASALSRIGGIAAPLIGGVLVSINPTLVVLASFGVFIISGILLLLLDRSLRRPGIPSSGTSLQVDEGS